MRKGKIKVVNGNKLQIVTLLKSYINDGSDDHEETVDNFTFEEVIKFIKRQKKK